MMRTRTARALLGALLGSLLALAGCDDGTSPASPDAMAVMLDDGVSDTSDAMPDMAPHAIADMASDAMPEPQVDPACEALVPEYCLFPWPSDHFLTVDETRDSGYRLTPPASGMPVSQTGIPVEPALVARADGFPIGTPIVTLIPLVDDSTLPGEESIERSLEPDSTLGLFEATADGLRAIPAFAELDLREDDPALRVLFVRPAVILKADTRYVVALRGLSDLSGEPITPTAAFSALRDGTADGALGGRQLAFDAMFDELDAIGWARSSLTSAWQFRTASARSLHGDLLHMRDDAIARIAAEGRNGPALTITEVEEIDPAENAQIALRVHGTMRVPHYMRPVDGFLQETAYVFNRGPDGLPAADGWREAPFLLLVPRVALGGPPVGLIQHGHGLNGSRRQTDSGHFHQTAAEGYLYFGLDLIGMSSGDSTNTVGITYDINRFVWLADRLHQGIIESLLLARAMRFTLPTLPELAQWQVTVDPDRLYYEGHSQGGIFGATILALSTQIDRGMLGVPGQNYSTLLERSVDFDPFFAIFDAVYQRRFDQVLLLALMQVLWDSTDPVSHYRHLVVDPHPGSGPNRAILATAKGDWQVALLTAEIVARSDIGVALMENYDLQRRPALIEPVAYPHEGSGLINWHYGNPWPAAGNRPPRDDLGDPHGRPRRDPDYRWQMLEFFRTGRIVDVCEGGLCPRRRP